MILSMKQLLQLREWGVNFYATNYDGRKEGVYNDEVIALKRNEDIFRKPQSVEEFEYAISQPNFCAVFTDGSLAFIIDDDTGENVKVPRRCICTYREKADRSSFHYFAIAKTKEDLERLAAKDEYMEHLEVFTSHKNRVVDIQGHFREDNEKSEPKASWFLKGGDLEKTKEIPIVSYNDIAQHIPEWGESNSSSDNPKSIPLKKYLEVDIDEPPPPHKAHDLFNRIAIKCIGFFGYDEQQTLEHLERLNSRRTYLHTGNLQEYVISAKKYVKENKDLAANKDFFSTLNKNEKKLFRAMQRDAVYTGLDADTVRYNLHNENIKMSKPVDDNTIERILAEIDSEKEKHAQYVLDGHNQDATKYDADIFESISKKGTIDWKVDETGDETVDEQTKKASVKLVRANLHRILGTYVMRYYSFLTNDKTDEMYVYIQGAYRKGGDVVIKSALTQAVPSLATREINEVVKYCQRMTYVDPQEFDKYPDLLNFKNGFYNIKTGIFYDAATRDKLQKRIFFMKMFNVDYTPDAKCPGVEEFLEVIIPDEQMRVEVLERLALSLIPHYTHGKCISFLGISNNGKTQLMELLIYGIHGVENIASLSLQEMVEGVHSLEQLIGKTINISGDLPKKGIEDLGRVKNLIEGSPVSTNPKNKPMYDKIFNMMFYALSNHAIDFDDTQSGWKRMEVFHFTTEIAVKAEIKNIGRKLGTSEGEGFLMLLLQHARNIVENGVTNVQKWNEARDKWRVIPDRIKQAVGMGVLQASKDDDCYITASQIYGLYVDMMTKFNENNTKNNLPIEKILKDGRAFMRRLHIAVPTLDEIKKRTKINGEHEWIYPGFKLNEKNKGTLFTT